VVRRPPRTQFLTTKKLGWGGTKPDHEINVRQASTLYGQSGFRWGVYKQSGGLFGRHRAPNSRQRGYPRRKVAKIIRIVTSKNVGGGTREVRREIWETEKSAHPKGESRRGNSSALTTQNSVRS